MVIPEKIELLDRSFASAPITSFAELGCTWGVDGAYGFHALDHNTIERAVQVDGHISDVMKERARTHPQLRQLQRNFGDGTCRPRSGTWTR